MNKIYISYLKTETLTLDDTTFFPFRNCHTEWCVLESGNIFRVFRFETFTNCESPEPKDITMVRVQIIVSALSANIETRRRYIDQNLRRR